MKARHLFPFLCLAACGGPTSAEHAATGPGGATTTTCPTYPPGGLPAAPDTKPGPTAGQTTPAADPWQIKTYNLDEPYAVPTTSFTPPKLLVFLPGSLAQAKQYKKILSEAAAIGYYAVGISYPNGAEEPLSLRTLTVICDNNIHADPGKSFDCYTQLRANRLDGTPEQNGIKPGATCNTTLHQEGCFTDYYMVDQVSVTVRGKTQKIAPEGIENRLYQLVNYLGKCDTSTPDTNWCSFIDKDAKKPLYNLNLVLAGHSQGGGEAAYIAKIKAVSGVAMFSAPEDAAVGSDGLCTGNADWLSDSKGFKTSLAHFYGLTHEQDEFFPRIEGAWNAFASSTGATTLPDTVACVDPSTGTAVPKSMPWAPGKAVDPAPCYTATKTCPKPAYGGAHRLYTNNAPVGLVYPYHDGTVIDLQTPDCPSGQSGKKHPLLTPAWRDMLYKAGRMGTVAPKTCDG